LQSVIPGSKHIPAADEQTLLRTEALIHELAPSLIRPWAMAQRLLDQAALATSGHRLHDLSPERRDAMLRRWESDRVLAMPLSVLALAY
jgi:hypothetical protein